MKEVNQLALLVTHVVLVRFFDEEMDQDRRVTLYAYGQEAARCLALTLASAPFAFVSTTPPYIGATKNYKVSAVEWAPL